MLLTLRASSANNAIPTYRTPEGAVGAFMHLVSYRRNQKHLTQTPESNTDDAKINKEAAKALVNEFLLDEQSYLSTHQASQILTHYGIDCIQTEVAYTPTEAKEQAIELGFPVALKLISPSIPSKSEVGGVVLNLNDAHEVEQTAFAMLLRIKNTYPDAHIEGFSLQKMAPVPAQMNCVSPLKQSQTLALLFYLAKQAQALSLGKRRSRSLLLI